MVVAPMIQFSADHTNGPSRLCYCVACVCLSP